MVKIEKGKPLPDHTRLRFAECYAKLILEHCIQKFRNGIQMRDKPDLYCPDCDTGIEVTDIMSKEKREALKLWYMTPYVSPSQRKKNIERMKQLGVDYTGGVQAWPTIVYDNGLDSKPYLELYEAIRKKLKKLNYGNIELFGCNELLLFTELDFYGFEDHLIAEKLKACQKSSEVTFDSLYVVTVAELSHYNMKSGRLEKHYFDQFSIGRMARIMVEKGESDE